MPRLDISGAPLWVSASWEIEWLSEQVAGAAWKVLTPQGTGTEGSPSLQTQEGCTVAEGRVWAGEKRALEVLVGKEVRKGGLGEELCDPG